MIKLKKAIIYTLIFSLASFSVCNASAAATSEKKVSITVSAVGDCTFGSDISSPSSVNFYSVYNRVKPDYFLKKVKPIFKKDDLTIVNLEGTLTKSNTRMDKKFAFRGDPSCVNILKKGMVEAVAFANNHCHDYGSISYTDTINTLKKAKIKYSSYTKESIYKVKGKRIGMVSVNGLEGHLTACGQIATAIKKLKKRKADVVIVSMHAGIEHTTSISKEQTLIAHYAIDNGANLVLGHHPHVLQGIERYRKAYIVYSLGNFCFGGNTNPADKDTMIFQQTFTFTGNKLDKAKGNAKVIACSISSMPNINNYQPAPLKGDEKKRVLWKIHNCSKPLGVSIGVNKGRVK